MRRVGIVASSVQHLSRESLHMYMSNTVEHDDVADRLVGFVIFLIFFFVFRVVVTPSTLDSRFTESDGRHTLAPFMGKETSWVGLKTVPVDQFAISKTGFQGDAVGLVQKTSGSNCYCPAD